MKIVSLKAENFKRLVAVEIDPKGNMVEIRGKNGSGKSSVLDAISSALEGKAVEPAKSIRDGEKTAYIELDLGDYKVTKTFKSTEDGEVLSSLKVENKEGKPVTSPQTLLDKMLGSLSIDPLRFANADQKEQIQLLRSLVKDFDFKASEKAEKDAYDERTVVNRNKQNSSIKHEVFKDLPLAEPEKVDVKGLTETMAEASRKNADRQTAIGNKEAKTKEIYASQCKTIDIISDLKSEIHRLQDEIVEMEKKIESHKKGIEVHNSTLSKTETELKQIQGDLEASKIVLVPDEINIDSIKKNLDEASIKNEVHEKWMKRIELKKEIEAYQAQSDALTDKIASLQTSRKQAIINANLPVQNLEFTDEGVMLNGLPFEQASDAERLRTSVALAMAQSPELKFIRVKEGSLLDEDGLKLLSDLAEKNQYQIWIEIVDSKATTGFILENGSLKQ